MGTGPSLSAGEPQVYPGCMIVGLLTPIVDLGEDLVAMTSNISKQIGEVPQGKPFQPQNVLAIVAVVVVIITIVVTVLVILLNSYF